LVGGRVHTPDHTGRTGHRLPLGGWRPDPRGGSTQEAAGTTDSRATAEITALCFSTPTPALTSTIQGSEEGAKTTALVPGPPTSIARRRAKLRRDLKVARTYPQAGRRVALDGSWDHHPPLGVAHGGSAGRGAVFTTASHMQSLRSAAPPDDEPMIIATWIIRRRVAAQGRARSGGGTRCPELTWNPQQIEWHTQW